MRRNGTIRCAIYTRKSSEEGLEQEFNSLQAQREACEAFIDSQRHEGWVCLRTALARRISRTRSGPSTSRRLPPARARWSANCGSAIEATGCGLTLWLCCGIF